MDNLTSIKEYQNHEDPIIANIARELLSLHDGVDNGHITKEQFEELCDDVLELQEIRQMTESLDRKIMLLKTITTIRTLVEGLIL